MHILHKGLAYPVLTSPEVHQYAVRSPAGCVEGDTAYVVEVAVCDQHSLLKHRGLRAAPNVQRQLAAGQYQACLLQPAQCMW
jgi:hypothetical protein